MASMSTPEQAKIIFDTICSTLDNHEWNYEKNEEHFVIGCTARGDDLPMDLTIRVDAERGVVMLYSKMPFPIPEDKRLDLAVAISALNNKLADGCFDYNIASGEIFFRLTNSYIDCTLSEAVFDYMLYCGCQVVDEYNDTFLMIAKGMCSLEQFLGKLES